MDEDKGIVFPLNHLSNRQNCLWMQKGEACTISTTSGRPSLQPCSISVVLLGGTLNPSRRRSCDTDEEETTAAVTTSTAAAVAAASSSTATVSHKLRRNLPGRSTLRAAGALLSKGGGSSNSYNSTNINSGRRGSWSQQQQVYDRDIKSTEMADVTLDGSQMTRILVASLDKELIFCNVRLGANDTAATTTTSTTHVTTISSEPEYPRLSNVVESIQGSVNATETVPLEQIERITMPAAPTCHAFNMLTRAPNCLELLVGLSNGTIIVRESFSKVSRVFNRELALTTAAVTAVQWVPGTEGIFVAAFADGLVAVFDRDIDDVRISFVSTRGTTNILNTISSTSDTSGHENVASEGSHIHHGTEAAGSTSDDDMARMASVAAHNCEGCIFEILSTRKGRRSNPTSLWSLGRYGACSIQFSPDCQHLAIAGRDGYLRVVHFERQQLVVAWRSFFGAFLCVNWSPDGRLLVTGGEDDLITVWSFDRGVAAASSLLDGEESILARGVGHMSWISDVAIDPLFAASSPPGAYRFISVGQDGLLLVWELNVAEQPAVVCSPSVVTKAAVDKPTPSASIFRKHNKSSGNGIPIRGSACYVIAAPPMRQVRVITPFVTHRSHRLPCCGIEFFSSYLFTCSIGGEIRLWERPNVSRDDNESLQNDRFFDEKDTPVVRSKLMDPELIAPHNDNEILASLDDIDATFV